MYLEPQNDVLVKNFSALLGMELPSAKITRTPHILEKVVFVGGHPGCGKTLLTPIIGSLDRVEIQKFNYTVEHICSLYALGNVDQDVSSVMIRMLTDLDIYNMMMSRETNFRFKDLSSIFKNPKPWRYIRRLFTPGDDETLIRIKKEKPILQITTHNLLVISPPLFNALGNRLRIINMVRHPLYMVKQWYCYIDLYGKDPRDFTIWFDYKGKTLPFFARGWEEKYLNSNSMDRVIYSIDHLSRLEELVAESLTSEQRSQLLLIPFEQFVLDPWPYMKRMETLLGTKVTSATLRELKKQKVPRKMIADGIVRPIYKKYGWQPPEKGANEKLELEKRREFAAQYASAEGMNLLDKISTAYETKYLKELVS